MKSYWPFRDELVIDNDIILKGDRVIIPTIMQTEILNKIIAHQGIEKMKLGTKTCVFWNDIITDIDMMVKKLSSVPRIPTCRNPDATWNTNQTLAGTWRWFVLYRRTWTPYSVWLLYQICKRNGRNSSCYKHSKGNILGTRHSWEANHWQWTTLFIIVNQTACWILGIWTRYIQSPLSKIKWIYITTNPDCETCENILTKVLK